MSVTAPAKLSLSRRVVKVARAKGTFLTRLTNSCIPQNRTLFALCMRMQIVKDVMEGPLLMENDSESIDISSLKRAVLQPSQVSGKYSPPCLSREDPTLIAP